MRQSRAFTLIELLVVIAIIAILAAILFPVFAQAKVAAKGAASISNAKQMTTSSFIYSSDYDDVQILVGFPDPTATANGVRPWSSNIQPYMKSVQLLGDPLTSFKNPGFSTLEIAYVNAPQFTYAWQIHSPAVYYGGATLTWNPLSQTGLANPADTVFMMAKRSGYAEPEYWYGSANFVLVSTWSNGVPFCSGGYTGRNPNSLCGPGFNSWGIGSVSGAGSNEVEGDFTGGTTVRKAGQSVLTFADGHAKTMPPGKAAAGTNYSKTQNQSATVITDITKYMWDAD